MKRMKIVVAAALLSGAAGCGMLPQGPLTGWKPMLDGSSFAGWNRIGEANWRYADGAMVADKGVGFLVSRETYGDFELKAEFYAEADTNSGIFIRCQDPAKIAAASCYEVNIWDTRPGQEYSTGAIVDVAKVSPVPKAGGKWNTFHITAKGDKLTVVMNGVKTAEATHGKFAKGVIGLQHAKGTKDDLSPIRFRNVQIKPL